MIIQHPTYNGANNNGTGKVSSFFDGQFNFGSCPFFGVALFLFSLWKTAK
jgi:hypothetical protein